MSTYLINGGKKLRGTIKTNSAKNATVAILAALPAVKGITILKDVPRIEEVNRLIEVLQSIGLKITWQKEHRLQIVNKGKINLANLNKNAFVKTRSALLLMGALCGLKKTFQLPHSGGCELGSRTVNPYLSALAHLNIKVKTTKAAYQVDCSSKKGAGMTMSEIGDTATENTILAAALTPGKTEIHLASYNYMVQDLCYFLQTCGAKIQGIGTHHLIITGVKNLRGVTYGIMPDPIESMALAAIAVVTKSALQITHCPLDFLRLELELLRLMGQKFIISKPYLSTNGKFNLVNIKLTPATLRALPDKLHPLPYPGLNIDNLPLFVPILTQARGITLVHDWIYENRAIYYTELNRLGAKVMLLDPHRVTVTGPTKLRAAEIVCPPALRPSINLLICMLGAKGKSILRNAYPIERGYEDLVSRLRALGADVKKI